MEEKQINKWLRRRFTGIGWALVVYYVIMNIMVMATVVVDMVSQQLRALMGGSYAYVPDMEAIANNAWGYLLAVAIGLLILYVWKGGSFWRWDVMAKERPMTASTFFCVLSLCIGTQMVNTIWIYLLELILNQFGLSAMGMLESVSGQSDSFSMFVYTALCAPIAEELIFRGFVLRSLRPYGKRFAILGSAVLLGLFHGNLLQPLYAFLMGLVLGYVTVEYSIVWAMALHLFNNLVLADLLSRLTAGLPELAVSVINLVIFAGFAIAGMVILAMKRQEVGEYNRSEWIDRRCLKCFFTNSGFIVLAVIMAINMILMLFV